MNSTKPVTLVIASVLKPVDDVRMYKKFAKSLARTGKYAVNIIGFYSKMPVYDPTIRFYPLFTFHRLSGKRLLANYFFYQTLKKISPQLIILTTPELFPAVVCYRKRFGVQVVYDIVENYRRNIRHNRGFSSWLIAPLTSLLSFIENRLLVTSQLLLLAEKGYQQELKLPEKTPIQTIENKALKPMHLMQKNKQPGRPMSIIYTGTVSEVYGIEQALAVIKMLIEQEGFLATFTMLGHVPQTQLHKRLQKYARHHPWLVLRTSPQPVPHTDIIALIEQADFGIVSHQPVPSIAHCFPTRIWEYMAYRLPFLLQAHPYWTTYCQPWQCAIPLDFNRPVIHEVRQRMTEEVFYPRGVPDAIYWETEQRKLTEAVEGITTRLLEREAGSIF